MVRKEMKGERKSEANKANMRSRETQDCKEWREKKEEGRLDMGRG